MQKKMTNSRRAYLGADFQPTTGEPMYVRKKVISSKHITLENNEAVWLKKLEQMSWAPKLIKADAEGILMTYVGKPVTAITLPVDWKDQVTTILSDMVKIPCSHNDIKTEEILILNGKIHLIDFQHMTDTREEFIRRKRSGECGCRINWTDHDAFFTILGNMEKRK